MHSCGNNLSNMSQVKPNVVLSSWIHRLADSVHLGLLRTFQSCSRVKKSVSNSETHISFTLVARWGWGEDSPGCQSLYSSSPSMTQMGAFCAFKRALASDKPEVCWQNNVLFFVLFCNQLEFVWIKVAKGLETIVCPKYRYVLICLIGTCVCLAWV